MIVGILVSVFAGFLAYGIVYLAGDENQGLSILLGLVTSGVALIGIWLWGRHRQEAPVNPEPEIAAPAPKFDAVFAWGSDADGPVLEIVVRNVGTKQGAIQAVYIRTPHKEPELASEEWDLDFLRPAFGVVLDTDQVTSPLFVPLGTARRELERLLRALTEGRAKLAIESTRGEVEIPIPATEQGPPPPTI